MPTGNSDDDGVTPLHQLVRREAARRGWTEWQVTHASDGLLARSTVNAYMHGNRPLRTLPRAKTIRGFATAFSLSLDEVRRAAQQSVPGAVEAAPLPGDTWERMILAAMDGLTPAEKADAVGRFVEIVDGLRGGE